MGTSTEFYEKNRQFKNEISLSIKQAIGKRKKITFEDSFKDEANNEIVSIDKKNVYFDGMMEKPAAMRRRTGTDSTGERRECVLCRRSEHGGTPGAWTERTRAGGRGQSANSQSAEKSREA